MWPGLVALALLYLLVLAVGLRAARQGPTEGEAGVEELLLAGRSLPLGVALLTMTATWVGGGYINGTAETAYTSGLWWGLQPGLGYALSLVLGGLFFARPMRRRGYATLLDPFHERYGPTVAAVVLVVAVLAEVFWSAAILVALGSTFGTVLGLPLGPSVVLSASVALGYTLVGGLRSVAYTDVLQLGLIAVGMALALWPVVEVAGGLQALWDASSASGALAFPTGADAVSWGDWTLLLMLGGIPWNVYFQRVLSARDEVTASRLSLWAGPLCAAMAVPPLLMGLAARTVDWQLLGQSEAAAAFGGAAGVTQALADSPSLVLPMLLWLAVPGWVAVVGLGAVSAAVMSSVDSSVLSASSLVAHNGLRGLYWPEAPPAVVRRWLRGGVIVLGATATAIALAVQSVAALWYLCGDLVYCLLFPQLALALFDERATRNGALSGLAVALLLRLGGGEPTLGLPALLPYPHPETFPFRTLAMLAGGLTSIVVARAVRAR